MSMMDWCIVQLRKSNRVGIGLYGKLVINGIQENRFLVWLPHLGPVEYFGERKIIDGKKNYIVVKPENVATAIEISHIDQLDELENEAKKIWK